MVIKAVIFDIDGVLVDAFDANLRFYQDLFKKANLVPITRAQYKRGVHRTLYDTIKIFGKYKNEEEIKKVLQLASKVKRSEELYKFPSHLDKTIKKLSKSYKLAVVTSRIKAGAENVLNYSKMGKYFPIVVYWGQYKNPKPDPESLFIATERLKIKPHEAVYIGDSLTDIQAAKAAGMKMILFSKKKLKGADVTTAKFTELPKLIAKL